MDELLRVEEAYRSDVGKQVARISSTVAKRLMLTPQDILKIEGQRVTYAKPMLTSSIERSETIIRMESTIRYNAGTNLDNFVKVSKSTAKLADELELTAVNQGNLIISSNLNKYLSQAIIERIMYAGDFIPINIGFGHNIVFRVDKTKPAGPVIFTDKTKTSFIGISDVKDRSKPKEEIKIGKKDFQQITYEEIGGLDEPIRKIREMIELPLRHPELFERLGISPPKGVLLYGPPGTGKTLLAKAVANETSSNFITINGPEIISKYYGESENKIREIFDEAEENAPTIIFIDELDSIAPKRSEVTGETERRIVAQLLTSMDGLESRGQVVVIAATNRPDSIDEALRRGGRFDREIEIGIPDRVARHEILQIHTRGMPIVDDVDLNTLSEKLHGYVGADIASLAKEAAMLSLRRIMPNIDLSRGDPVSTETLSLLNITMSDFESAMTEIIPSAMREIYTERPNVDWDDIGGLHKTKDELEKAIEWPIRFPEIFKRMNKVPASGILLYGPPGTGKTMLAKAVANKTEANFISIKGPELFSKWVGESERGIREIFRKARAAAPCVIFFDEIDAIASTRGISDSSGVSQKVVSQLLTEIDGLVELKGVFILAATNRPDIIDPALRRPGRFDKIIEVGMPDAISRKEIFEAHLKGLRLAAGIDTMDLANQTNGYTGAEIAAIIDEARMLAIQEFVEISLDDNKYDENALDNLMITLDHINLAMESILPLITQYNLKPPSPTSFDYS
ncbi:MAG: CDC48 family AAA ATPase [Candidatus Kariarchaeaceae archaeon]|jgi:transitional endoplasmic reticulum ATPase